MAAAASRSTLNVPMRLTLITKLNASKSWGVPSRATTLDTHPTPAQLTAMRNGPWAAASSTAASTWPGSATSV